MTADAPPVTRDVLRAHYLAEVICDHEGKRDNPVCSCSLVFLGWHPSVGAAVDAWVDHVMEQARRAEWRRSLRSGTGGGDA